MGLTNTSGSFVDGVFECGFVRQRYVENTKKIFDLEKPWKILFATGRAKNGNWTVPIKKVSSSMRKTQN